MSYIEKVVFNSTEAAQYLGISKATFFNYIKSGLIKKGIVYSGNSNTCRYNVRTVWRKKYLEQEQTAEG